MGVDVCCVGDDANDKDNDDDGGGDGDGDGDDNDDDDDCCDHDDDYHYYYHDDDDVGEASSIGNGDDGQFEHILYQSQTQMQLADLLCLFTIFWRHKCV